MPSEAELKRILKEVIDAVEELLQDPDVQQAIPKKYRIYVSLILKIVRVVVE